MDYLSTKEIRKQKVFLLLSTSEWPSVRFVRL